MPLAIVFGASPGFNGYSPQSVPAGSPAATPCGSIRSSMIGPIGSVLSGNVAIGAFSGGVAQLTTTAVAPSSGTIDAHLRVDNAAGDTAEEFTIHVPVAASAMAASYTVTFQH